MQNTSVVAIRGHLLVISNLKTDHREDLGGATYSLVDYAKGRFVGAKGISGRITVNEGEKKRESILKDTVDGILPFTPHL